MGPRAPQPSAALAVLALVAAAAGGAGGCGGSAGLEAGPRHLLLVTLSGVRADHTSAYQYPRPTTAWPTDGAQRALGRALAIDDLAARGLLCSEAWSPAEDQLSALKALLTGRATPFGEVITGLEGEQETLAEKLRAAGFRTAAFVSGPELAAAGGFERGFDHYMHRPTDEDALRWALRWLMELDLGDGRPLCLWIHLAGAQPPWSPGSAPPTPGPVADELDYVALAIDEGFAASLPALDYGALYPLPPGQTPGPVDRYDGGVAELAGRFRSFLQAYREVGLPSALFDDTALVLAGISGAELGEHGWSSSLYAPALRVPLLFHHRGSVRGRRISAALVSLDDVAPTALEWLAAAPAPRVRQRRGRSLLGLLTGTDEPAPRPVASVGRGGVQAASLRGERYTLVWSNGPDGERSELYDRGLDPLELRDIAARRPGLAAELRDELVWLLTEVSP